MVLAGKMSQDSAWHPTKIQARPATQADSAEIFAWRNDAQTRRMSHTIDIVAWEAHHAWFTATLADSGRCLLMCTSVTEESGVVEIEKLAAVRFDLREEVALISINVNPERRGAGIGKHCLQCALNFLKERHSRIRIITAEIKVHNSISIRIFEALGFVYQETRCDTLYYERAL